MIKEKKKANMYIVFMSKTSHGKQYLNTKYLFKHFFFLKTKAVVENWKQTGSKFLLSVHC